MFQPEISIRTFRMMGKAMADAFVVPFRDLPRHAAILSLIIGGFWLLDSLKDPVLSAIVGMEYQPLAKLFSVFFTLLVVCCYDFLTSLVTKPSLFHIVSILFGVVFMIIAALLSHPVTGLGNREKGPIRLIGWFTYFAIEVYGSLMVALFWSFTNSLMDLEQAKGAYGLIICFAQVGAITGSTLATHAAEVGIPKLFLVASVSIMSVSLLIKVYHIVFQDKVTKQVEEHRVRRVTGTSEDLQEMIYPSSTSAAPVKLSTLQSIASAFSGFYEGLFLIAKYSYVMHIMGVTCLYEIVLTVMDYEFKLLGADRTTTASSDSVFEEGSGDTNDFANLLGHFGQVTNVVSLLVSSVGFSFLVHRLGVRYTLLIFPILLFLGVIITNLVPSLWVLFFFVSLLKAVDYSLYDPVKELLYMPTSEPIKFKAKAWIDVLGARIAKGLGSLISYSAAGNAKKLRHIAEIPSIILSLCFLVIVFVAGRKFDRLVRDGTIVGNEDEDNVGMELNSLKSSNSKSSHSYYDNLQPRNGVLPGDVGYDGYDMHLFEGVFSSDDENGSAGISGGNEEWRRRKSEKEQWSMALEQMVASGASESGVLRNVDEFKSIEEFKYEPLAPQSR